MIKIIIATLLLTTLAQAGSEQTLLDNLRREATFVKNTVISHTKRIESINKSIKSLMKRIDSSDRESYRDQMFKRIEKLEDEEDILRKKIKDLKAQYKKLGERYKKIKGIK